MEYDLDSYPEVKKSIVEGLSDQGFELTERSEYPPRCAQITAGCFELQAHLKSVAEHTDHLSRGLYFGIYVLKSIPAVKSIYTDFTVLNYFLGHKKHSTRLRVGELCVFNPNRPHSLIYYGEKTTYMLFTVKRKKPCK